MIRPAVAVALAFLFHGVLGVGMWVTGALTHFNRASLPTLLNSGLATRDAEPDEPLKIETLVDELDKPATLSEAEKKREKELESKDVKGQVVDIARPAIEQRPEDARFLSEYDSQVQKQQRGPHGKDKAGAQEPSAPPPTPAKAPPAPSQPPVQPQPPVLAMQQPRSETSTHRIPGPRGAESEITHVGPDGTLPHRAGQGQPEPRPREALSGAAASAGSRPRARLNLMPSSDAMARVLGQGAGSPDYLNNMDDGDSTALNAKKWKFASFFNRLKQSVREEWHPDSLLSRHDPSGNIYGAKDRVTVLRVHLQPNGRIADIQVLKQSGVDFLDDEAMGAFRRAQPFENPPAGLVDQSDGLIHFNFGFVVELSGRTSFKVWRYDN